MNSLLSRLALRTILLYLFVTVAQVASGFYVAGELEPSPAFTLLYTLGFLWAIGWWLRADSRERGIGWVLDMGLFLYLAWPFIMVYYLLKTRGVRGFLAVAAFAALYVGAALAGVVLYVLLTPETG